MAFPGANYAPPGVYTRTLFESPLAGAIDALKIPVFIGEGNESLFQQDLEVVRGSSSSVDQRIPSEDETGRSVVSVSATGVVTRGDFNGTRDKFQVRNFPIVSGDGTGTTTNNRTDVAVTINGQPMVVLGVTGATGIVQIAQPPKDGDEVRCTYFYNRTDTLTTDDLSDQVDPDNAVVRGQTGIMDADAPGSIGGSEVLDLHGDILNAQGVVTVENNNTLVLIVDSVEVTIVIPPRTNYTMAQVAAAITAANVATLTGGSFSNNYGQSALQLNADHSIVIKNGTANGPLGLVSGLADNRVATFYTFQGPIVDGSNGGITTTDPSHVTVKVDGTQVIPTAVNGASRAVTLAVAPKAGSTVSITYYFNTWQDTFDYLAHIGVTSVQRCGPAPGSSAYVQEADFILKDDKILWGTADTIESGINTQGSAFFDDTQITGTLIDNRTYMTDCTPVVTSSGGVATDSRTRFLLPFSPTLGNGRDTPLGQSLFQTVSNNRIDLPTNRPDVVWAYWGFSPQDALERGRVDVLKVEGNVITLASAVAPGATVYATQYYNLLTDNEFTLMCQVAGVSGTGTYNILDKGNNDVFGPIFSTGSKGVSLNGVTIEFPSGSELSPDLRFEAGSGSSFNGPIEEIVTVEFASRVATPAKYSVPGGGPYEFISGHSDRLRVLVHGNDVTTSAGLDLDNPSEAHDGGFFGSLVGDEVVYTGGTVAVAGQAYDITASEQMYFGIDGADVDAKTSANVTNVTVGYFASVINEAASGHQSTAAGGGAATITLDPLTRSNVDDYYVNYRVVIGNGAAAATAGQYLTVTGYDGTTGDATVASNWAGAAVQAGDPYYIFKPDARSAMPGATVFDAPTTIVGGAFDSFRLSYTGDVSGVLPLNILLTPGTYSTSIALAAEIQAQLDLVATPANHEGLRVECVANSSAQMELRLQLPGVDSSGFIQVINAATAAADFAVMAGFDSGPTVGDGQAALLQGPVAKSYEVPALGPPNKNFDRLILRNRLLPGGGASSSMSAHFIEDFGNIEIKSGNTKAGLATGDIAYAASTATVQAATVRGMVGFSGGQNAVNGQPQVTFYDGSSVRAANDEFSFEMDGVPVNVTFTSTGAGTATDLGPATGASNGSVMDQIIDAMAAVPGNPWGTAAAIFAARMVRQEGTGIRLIGAIYNESARIVIGEGSANGVLGFVAGATFLRNTVTAQTLASALMASRTANFPNWLLDFTAAVGGLFAQYGIAAVEEDETGREFLYLQDAPTLVGDLGQGSSIEVRDTFQSIDNALVPFTGLNAQSGDGSTGEAALDGFFVVSNVAGGSGSTNTSQLNNGVGQDGIVGQTYRDVVTGLTFTLLPRGWHDNQTGPWTSYPTGPNATFRINVSKTFITNANIPHNALNGLELLVSNTANVAVGDTAIVSTFERGGQEPAVGDLYYTSYTYTKENYGTAFFTKMSAIEQAYGAVSPDNPVSLASYLAIINGAILVGINQVQRAQGSNYASIVSYRDAIDELEGTLPGQAKPDMITPLRGDSTELYQYLKLSNEVMSSIRYRSERTSIIGMNAGSLVDNAITLAKTLGHTRMRLVYPDIATISLTDALNNTKEYLVDGPMVASALTGSIVSPNLDVATPWTGRRLVGFTQLARVLDAVEQNQLAVNGVTVIEDQPPFLKVRHGLTTDMSNILTKLPTIVLIADEVQRQSRVTLDRFIGIKFLPGILSQIEGSVAMMLKALVAAAIITAYTGIVANVSPDDPTVAEVEAYYSPVFPLLYIILTFHLRSSL